MSKLTLLAFDIESLGGNSWDPTQLLAIGTALHLPKAPGRPLREIKQRTWRLKDMAERPEDEKGMNQRTLVEFWSKSEAEKGGREAWDRLRKEPLAHIKDFRAYVNAVCLAHPEVIMIGDNPAFDVPHIDFALESAGFEKLQRKPLNQHAGGGTTYTLILDMHSYLFGRLKNVHDPDAATGAWKVTPEKLMTELDLTQDDFSARKSHMPAEDATFLMERFIYAHDYGKTDKLDEEYTWTVINAEDGLSEWKKGEEFSDFDGLAHKDQALEACGMAGTTQEERDVYRLVRIRVLRGKRAVDAIARAKERMNEEASEVDAVIAGEHGEEEQMEHRQGAAKRAKLAPEAAAVVTTVVVPRERMR